ncbi:MAG: hypothetical protein AB4062_20155 [Crocosphaera sp.]
MNQLVNKRKIMKTISLFPPPAKSLYRLVLIVSVLTNLLLLSANYKLHHLYDMTIKELEQEMFFSTSHLRDI